MRCLLGSLSFAMCLSCWVDPGPLPFDDTMSTSTGPGAATTDDSRSDSCIDHCGGQAPAGCWCDTACLALGNCCTDAEICYGGGGSGGTSSGGTSSGGTSSGGTSSGGTSSGSSSNGGTTTGDSTSSGSDASTSGASTSDASTDGGESSGSTGESPEGSCGGVCGGESPGGCACDPMCEQQGTCCDDYVDLCQGDDPWFDLEGPALREALFQYTSATHVPLDADDALAAVFGQGIPPVDANDGQLECIYTGELTPPDGTTTPGGTFTVEHVWPETFGASADPRNADLHHIFPVTQTANAGRDDRWFGETACADDCLWSAGGSQRGPDDVGRILFEVRPAMRGDVARGVLYFCVRYDFGISPRLEGILRAWHAEDPPDSRELVRNANVEFLQGNRNPFIDYPALVARLTEL